MRHVTRLFVAATTLAATAVVGVGTASPGHAVQEGVLSGTVSPTLQTDGTVWGLAYAAGTVYALGDFTSVRPSGAAAGTPGTKRQYVAAFDATTGALKSFSHTFSMRPLAIATSPDGSRLYVGGNFTAVDGKPTGRLVAFSTSTGARIGGFAPAPSSSVKAIAATNGTVYFGGTFGKVGTAARTKLAAVGTAGALKTWAPTLDAAPNTLAVTPSGSTVYAGGNFNVVNGTPQRAVTALSGTTGTQLPFAAGSAMPAPTAACNSVVKDAVVAGDAVYFAAEGTGGGCFDGTFAADVATGALRWQNQCLGATQAVEVVQGWLYKGSHAHDCQRINTIGDPDAFPQVPDGQSRHLLAERLSNGFLGPWYPNTNGGNAGAGLGPRAMTTDGVRLWVGGEFTSVNGKPQQGLARFDPLPDTAPKTPKAPVVTSATSTSVTVSATVPLDLDDTDLVLELYRDGGSTPVATSGVQHSLFWRQPVVQLTDSGLDPGTTHSYRVRAVEAAAPVRGALSPAVSATLAP